MKPSTKARSTPTNTHNRNFREPEMDSKELIETKLEPEVAKVATGGMDQATAISIAISLKRIADLLDGTTVGICASQTVLGRQASN